MQEYAQSHTNSTNIFIHKICVPLIFLSIIGIFWPVNLFFMTDHFSFNLGMALLLFSFLIYLKLSVKYAFYMLPILILMGFICYYLNAKIPLTYVSIVVFAIAWIFQFIGHKLEGKSPSFFKDLVFLMIGPLWVLRFVIQRMTSLTK